MEDSNYYIWFKDLRSVEIKSNKAYSYNYCLFDPNVYEVLGEKSSLNGCFITTDQKDSINTQFIEVVDSTLMPLIDNLLDKYSKDKYDKIDSFLMLIEKNSSYQYFAFLPMIFRVAGDDWEIISKLIRYLSDSNEFQTYRSEMKSHLLKNIYPLLFHDEYFVRNSVSELMHKYPPSKDTFEVSSSKFLTNFDYHSCVDGLCLIKDLDIIQDLNIDWLKLNLIASNSVQTCVNLISLMKINSAELESYLVDYLRNIFKTKDFPHNEHPESILFELLYYFRDSNVKLDLRDYDFILNYHEDLEEDALLNAYYDEFENTDIIVNYVKNHIHSNSVLNFIKFLKKENQLPPEYNYIL